MFEFGWTGKMNCLKFEVNKMYCIEDNSREKWTFAVGRVHSVLHTDS